MQAAIIDQAYSLILSIGFSQGACDRLACSEGMGHPIVKAKSDYRLVCCRAFGLRAFRGTPLWEKPATSASTTRPRLRWYAPTSGPARPRRRTSPRSKRSSPREGFGHDRGCGPAAQGARVGRGGVRWRDYTGAEGRKKTKASMTEPRIGAVHVRAAQLPLSCDRPARSSGALSHLRSSGQHWQAPAHAGVRSRPPPT